MQPNRGPWRITLDTNPDDCNYRCTMCEEHAVDSPRRVARHGKARRRMAVELLRRVIEEAVPLGVREVIPSTMGEPLLYAHFDDILDLCRRHGLALNLTTNGSFPGRGAREWAELIVPVASDVKVSLNGVTAAVQEQVMCGSRLGSMLTGLRILAEVRDRHAASVTSRCTLTLQVTFMEANLAELPAFVRLAAYLGIDRVKGHHLWVHHAGMSGQSMRRSEDSRSRWNAVATQVSDLAAELGVRLANFEPLDTPGLPVLPGSAVCPFLGQEAWVAADGTFSPCCAPDDQRRTLGAFGSLASRSLEEIWASAEYQALLQGWAAKVVCMTCPMRRGVQ
jgi:MoaA/NifB/PqqE/SkfB family radical SAM enzyme